MEQDSKKGNMFNTLIQKDKPTLMSFKQINKDKMHLPMGLKSEIIPHPS
jgi:hypothetical protein